MSMYELLNEQATRYAEEGDFGTHVDNEISDAYVAGALYMMNKAILFLKKNKDDNFVEQFKREMEEKL